MTSHRAMNRKKRSGKQFLCAGIGLMGMGLVLVGCQTGAGSGGFSLLDTDTERWTIQCREFMGAEHRQDCEAVIGVLKSVPDVRASALSCDHDDVNEVSRLYYGNYALKINPNTNEPEKSVEINQDYMLVKSLQDNYKRRFFAEAIKTPAVGKRVERPEWALTKNSGKYSLQVASFFPEGGYRDVYASAVQYVEQLRKEGCEAYYYHGPSWSLVTVGSFGSEDVITQPNGQQRYSNRVESLQQKEEFKYNYENGQIRSRKLGSQTIQPKSFLIEVPRRPGEDK